MVAKGPTASNGTPTRHRTPKNRQTLHPPPAIPWRQETASSFTVAFSNTRVTGSNRCAGRPGTPAKASRPTPSTPTRGTAHRPGRCTACRAHEGCSFDAQMALCRASSSVSPRACDAIAPEQCLPWTGCVLDHGNGRPSCRAPADACEVLPPMTSAPSSFSDPYQSVYGQLVLGGADPCRNHDGCAFDLRSRLCRSYTPVAACPETLEEARSVHVACGHPDQPSLECRYRDDGRRSTFHCHRPSWNGGMAPPPEFENRPAVWRESAHQQDNGCPASRFGLRDRCRRARGRSCHLDDSIYECIGGRWRETRRLPPRP